jgi:glucosyl-dolichyl phosphate glucuronosyltransferase
MSPFQSQRCSTGHLKAQLSGFGARFIGGAEPGLRCAGAPAEAVVTTPRLHASVIVPTYQRPGQALCCVESLAAQDADGFEVIVVDNACDSALAEKIAAVKPGAASAIRYLAEPILGLHNGRHAGARAAEAQLLLFTDDDAVCSPAWVRSYVEAFAAHPEIVAAGGPVSPNWLAPPPGWLLHFAEAADTFPILSLMEPHDHFVISSEGFFFGVNMAIRRDALFDLGGFNPESFGSIWLGDGETGLNLEIWERNLQIAYVPEARVFHSIPQERMTLRYFKQRMRNQGAADMYTSLHLGTFRRRNLIPRLRRTLRDSGRIWAASLLRRGQLDADSLALHLSSAHRAGEASYLIRLLISKRLWPLVTRKRWLDPEPGDPP